MLVRSIAANDHVNHILQNKQYQPSAIWYDLSTSIWSPHLTSIYKIHWLFMMAAGSVISGRWFLLLDAHVGLLSSFWFRILVLLIHLVEDGISHRSHTWTRQCNVLMAAPCLRAVVSLKIFFMHFWHLSNIFLVLKYLPPIYYWLLGVANQSWSVMQRDDWHRCELHISSDTFPFSFSFFRLFPSISTSLLFYGLLSCLHLVLSLSLSLSFTGFLEHASPSRAIVTYSFWNAFYDLQDEKRLSTIQ